MGKVKADASAESCYGLGGWDGGNPGYLAGEVYGAWRRPAGALCKEIFRLTAVVREGL